MRIALLQVGALVDVDVAHAVQVLDHRDARFGHDALDQALAAARHDDVDVPVHAQQLAHRGAVGRVHDLDRVLRQAGRAQALMNAAGDRAVGADRLGAAAQDGRVARFQAQRRGVRGDVGPRLVDDADDPERHAHPADLDAGRAFAQVAHFAYRIGQGRDLFQSLRHRLDACRRRA